jgi:CBS domain-containing protein
MTSPVRRIAPDRPVAEAARRMLDGNVRRLAVVDEGRLVGIVSRADLVRAFARDRLKDGATTA